MDYKKKASEIDEFLRKNDVKIAKKPDICMIFNINHCHASPIWYAMIRLGYNIGRFDLRRRE